jgi:putative ABC transport system ATP-binding protein
MTRILEATDLYRFYHIGDDEISALRGITLCLSAGEFCVLEGPSGSGKSTLLSCLAGLDDPDGGTVRVMGERITRRPEVSKALWRARHIGILLQAGYLFDHLSVRGNIQLSMKIAGRGDPHSIDRLLHSLGLDGSAEAKPSSLSGGEAARAALAAVLAKDPEVLICDEPTAEVDAAAEALILENLVAAARRGSAVLVATHSSAITERADRVLSLRDGRLVDG